MTADGEPHDRESAAMGFEVLKGTLRDGVGARLGRLAIAGRAPIDTPNFIGVTSRGTLPHLTPDNIARHLQTTGAYMALEDFIEKPQHHPKRIPPVYQTPTTPAPSPAGHVSQPTPRLHAFTAMPRSVTTVLAARRLPAVPAPSGNTNKSISVFTSTGFQAVTTQDYLSAVAALSPDIAIPLADLTHSTDTPSSKRALRMAERTDEWIVEWFASLQTRGRTSTTTTATFAPILPVPYPIQWEYISRLAEDYVPTGQLAGLAVHNPDVLRDVAEHYPALLPLPRLSLSTPPTPHHILRQISRGGIDLFTIPFINALSDAGLALSFTFPPPPLTSETQPQPTTTTATTTTTTTKTTRLPLAIDLSDPVHASSLAPLTSLSACPCYACTAHHRAYVHHLLHAREMLGWTLLQIHNHAVVASFFQGVRDTLLRAAATSDSSTGLDSYNNSNSNSNDGNGGNGRDEIERQETFDQAMARFTQTYEADFPEGAAERPRARGYQFKSVGGGEGKRNKPAWGRFDGADEGGEGGLDGNGGRDKEGGESG
ncbi:tRNA-guanine(15) transglycosylase-like protein [Chaetomium sp. MPI-SDFR-AT-0129]|nr:tRNA-guanine(15) transglycosylase-like protein [Chaetomium sp. MPI-SDFR-AT-0129]